MTILDVLEQDHDRLRALVLKVDEAADDMAHVGLEALFHEFKIKVLAHTRAEEDTFYAALQAIDATEDAAEHAVDEHEAVEAVLALLDTVDVGSATWRAGFHRLREALLQHIADEESALFTAARAVLDEAAQRRLAHAFDAERQRLLDSDSAVLARKSA
ncbi:MAG: hemerythrin domain-containing protein [Alphaproteobacteria bacterium]|nr:hemerythrin domain-containing protein [Alphaproteobacteria bacterium]